MRYLLKYLEQKNFYCNTEYNIKKDEEGYLIINIDNIINIKIIDENTIICNNITFNKNIDENRFDNFIINSYIVRLEKIDDTTIYVELLRHYINNVTFTKEPFEV